MLKCVCGNKLCHDSISPLYCNHLKVERDIKVGMRTFQEGEKNIRANTTVRVPHKLAFTFSLYPSYTRHTVHTVGAVDVII